MSKVTLDMNTFKALASETRLDILRVLDGKKLNLKDICNITTLNKATLHEHLSKLHDAGLVKRKERKGHKWVYYKLTWKGESLLHPENTKIVLLFTITFFTLWAGFIQLLWYVKGSTRTLNNLILTYDSDLKSYNVSSNSVNGNLTAISDIVEEELGRGMEALPQNSHVILTDTGVQVFYQNSIFLYVGIGCFMIFTTLLCIGLWRLWKNRTQKL